MYAIRSYYGGAYTLHVARTVGEKGMVYALDIQPSMLTQLELKLSRSENQDVSNVKLYENSAYDVITSYSIHYTKLYDVC